jgi:hypothetical protein
MSKAARVLRVQLRVVLRPAGCLLRPSTAQRGIKAVLSGLRVERALEGECELLGLGRGGVVREERGGRCR